MPNIVVDGSPNEATVLTLTHWPGYAQPPGFQFDLSAEMAFHYIDAPPPHAPADVVTNNHFDQDGLVGVHALVDPQLSRDHRDVLIDVAAAGDFGTYRDRRAARASMAIAAYADEDRSPLASRLTGSYDQQCALLYEETLPLLVPMVVDSDSFRDLWAEEDESLTISERMIEQRTVTIEEIGDVDLAIVTVPADESKNGGHRFAHETFGTLHPMAIHNRTTSLRLLVVHGREVEFVDRYETWVQYRSRRPRPHVDMRPLADELSDRELHGPRVGWRGHPGSLTPSMHVQGETSLDVRDVCDTVVAHLRGQEPAGMEPVPGGRGPRRRRLALRRCRALCTWQSKPTPPAQRWARL